MAHICNPIAKEKCTIDTILRCPHLNMLSINPNTKQITFSFDTYGDVLDIFFILNSKRFNANSYIIYSDDSAKTVSVKWGGVNSHMTSFLLIDNNRNTSAYITGRISGVAEISKGTGSAAPPVLDASLATLKVTLGPWSAAFLICLDLVTIS